VEQHQAATKAEIEQPRNATKAALAEITTDIMAIKSEAALITATLATKAELIKCLLVRSPTTWLTRAQSQRGPSPEEAHE